MRCAYVGLTVKSFVAYVFSTYFLYHGEHSRILFKQLATNFKVCGDNYEIIH